MNDVAVTVPTPGPVRLHAGLHVIDFCWLAIEPFGAADDFFGKEFIDDTFIIAKDFG